MIYAHIKPESLLNLKFLIGEGLADRELYFEDEDDFLYWFKEYDQKYTKNSIKRQKTWNVMYHLTWLGISRLICYYPSGMSYEIRPR